MCHSSKPARTAYTVKGPVPLAGTMMEAKILIGVRRRSEHKFNQHRRYADDRTQSLTHECCRFLCRKPGTGTRLQRCTSSVASPSIRKNVRNLIEGTVWRVGDACIRSEGKKWMTSSRHASVPLASIGHDKVVIRNLRVLHY